MIELYCPFTFSLRNTPKKQRNFSRTGFQQLPRIWRPEFQMTSVQIKYYISVYFILNARTFFHTFQVHKDNQFFAPGTSWNFFRVFGAPARLLPQAFPASKLRCIEFWTFKRTSFSTIPTLQYTIHCQSVRTCHQVVTTKINFMTLWPIRKILSPALRPQERGSTWW